MCFAQGNTNPEPIQQPASIADNNVQASGEDAKKRARAQAGAQSTILSTLMQPMVNVGQKQLMGQ